MPWLGTPGQMGLRPKPVARNTPVVVARRRHSAVPSTACCSSCGHCAGGELCRGAGQKGRVRAAVQDGVGIHAGRGPHAPGHQCRCARKQCG